MIYVRGQAHDFDDWAANGNDGWSWCDVLPYFRKLETHPEGDSEYHGGTWADPHQLDARQDPSDLR